ncbi:MAG: hypothetical protein FWG74_03710 [Planctomycetes bacterium]|nr:hypothetical protein [Planctomycetota bacterium]
MFDSQRLQDRLQIIKNNLRSFASTQCASAADLLRRDDLLDQIIYPVLESYDEELADLRAQRDAALKESEGRRRVLADVAANAALTGALGVAVDMAAKVKVV